MQFDSSDKKSKFLNVLVEWRMVVFVESDRLSISNDLTVTVDNLFRSLTLKWQ